MAYFQEITLRSLLENPELLNAPKINKDSDEKKKDGDSSDLGDFIGASAFLGPTLWDRTLPYDGDDFKLEYMDLDEFLSENGIPSNTESNSSADVVPGLMGTSSPKQNLLEDSDGSLPGVCLNSVQQASPGSTHLSSPIAPRSPQSSQPLGSPVSQQLGSPLSQQLGSPLGQQLGSPQSPRLGSPGSPQHQGSLSPRSSDSEVGSPAPSEEQEDSLSTALMPGQEGFDPGKRAFSEEELKPQPMIKKSKKVFVPEGLKDDKYWCRRKKNNIAAKRSRDARRVKENQIAMRAAFLEKENGTLHEALEKCRAENKELMKRLAKYEGKA